MPPKKAQKMSLNEFLVDSTLGSWADEMDALPTAPAARADGDMGRPGDRRRDDFMSSRPDRSQFPPREDLPLPTEPPYTAFVGNLAFDLTEIDLEEFFQGQQTKSIKIIKDRDEKPKGFGYVEFAELDGLKEALARTGSALAGRTVRVSVAEPPKERAGFGGGFDDDAKFAGNWRREGPLPDLPSRDGSRKRFDSTTSAREPPPPAVADNVSDWRSSRPPARMAPAGAAPDMDQGGPSFKRRGSGFRESGAPPGAADAEETWTIGSKFKPSLSEGSAPGSKFGAVRGRGDMGPPREAPSPPDEGDWRRPVAGSRGSTSPSNSTPPTPQLARRKLELLPRSNVASATPSPLSSPNPAASTFSAPRANPFGAAKPVDVTAKEAAVAERLEKERESTKERVMHSMSRTSSRTASQREGPASRSGPPSATPSSPKPESPKVLAAAAAAANVRPSVSFAAAAAKKDAAAQGGSVDGSEKADEGATEELTKGVAQIEV